MNIEHLSDLQSIFENADYIDPKTIDGRTSLREFIAGMLSYYPWWIVFLYQIRAVVVKILGLEKQEMPETLPDLNPDDVSFEIGQLVTFFKVHKAKESEYWIGETPEDKHLKAYVAIVVEPLDDGMNRFHVVTVIHYKHWTGPVYFNLIRPFHHLVVARMMHTGIGVNA